MSQWNKLTDIFGCNTHGDVIPECAADNICIAWPSVIEGIKKQFPCQSGLNALDFGCGGGLFCKKLYKMGFNVTGYDNSEELAKKAQENTPTDVTISGSLTEIEQMGKYDLITSIMVFQFIDDISSTIDDIISLLKPGGMVIYAVFNPKFIRDNLNSDVFTKVPENGKVYMELKKGIKIPFNNRKDSDYRYIFEKKNYKEVYIDYPKFTEEFLKKYNMPFSTKYSEYLIQAFWK
ncbi:MAG: hypothetical protein C0613_10590 [Desulfobulbaceae bacterium]|nr:MAG: hypothetical protein C0613_10590 [Desulfobulbaceae bacterium]